MGCYRIALKTSCDRPFWHKIDINERLIFSQNNQLMYDALAANVSKQAYPQLERLRHVPDLHEHVAWLR